MAIKAGDACYHTGCAGTLEEIPQQTFTVGHWRMRQSAKTHFCSSGHLCATGDENADNEIDTREDAAQTRIQQFNALLAQGDLAGAKALVSSA